MSTWQQRIRGALGMGVTWAVIWSVPGPIARWVFGINTDAPLGLILGALGFLAGVVFSAVLTATEGRRNLAEASMPRFAGWGAVGGVILAGIFARLTSLDWGDVLMLAPTLAAASAVSAAGSLALARRSARGELHRGDSVAMKSLAEEDRQKRLG